MCQGTYPVPLYTLGARKDVLIIGVSSFQGSKCTQFSMAFGDSNRVLFIKVSLFQGALLRGSTVIYSLSIKYPEEDKQLDDTVRGGPVGGGAVGG